MATLFIVLLILLYFLPSILGLNKHNIMSIFALNLFLGWTFIGWVVSLVWALSKDEQIVRMEQNEPDTYNQMKNISVFDEITKLNELKEKGILTEEEFNDQKNKLLNQ